MRDRCPAMKKGMQCLGRAGHPGMLHTYVTPKAKGKPPAKRKTQRRSERRRSRSYLYAVRGLPFCMVGWDGDKGPTPCGGIIEADHAGVRPVGRKADDDTAIPMCTSHHRERTDYAGTFDGYTAAEMRQFCDDAIFYTRMALREEFPDIAAKAQRERPGQGIPAVSRLTVSAAFGDETGLRSQCDLPRPTTSKASESDPE